MTVRHDRERPVRAALVIQERSEPREGGDGGIRVHSRGEVASDHEVGAFAAADLVGDHAADDVGVVLIGDVEAGIPKRHRIARQLGQHLVARDAHPLPHDEAAQRCGIVVTLEAPLPHLAEGNQREHLPGCARGIRERDVGQQVDIHHVAGEQLDGRTVACDEGERDAARSEFAK